MPACLGPVRWLGGGFCSRMLWLSFSDFKFQVASMAIMAMGGGPRYATAAGGLSGPSREADSGEYTAATVLRAQTDSEIPE